uniref:Uncharacterized protein n=1 Tax=Anguilla anguilla TaxID=7936 RepID=A0A0E9WQN6_ANGAN
MCIAYDKCQGLECSRDFLTAPPGLIWLNGRISVLITIKD